MENKTPEIVVIDKNAVIKFTITAGMIERLQAVMSHLMQGKTDEQLETFYEQFKFYNEIAKGQKSFAEDWMTPLTTMILFLQGDSKRSRCPRFLNKSGL